MKKHLTLPVAANHVLQPQQFPDDHETPTADIFPAGTVQPWEEMHLRKTHPYESLDETKRIPHSKLMAGQMVVDTKRVHDMMRDRPGGELEATGLPDGRYMLEDGHHRVAADILSGRKTSTVHVKGRWKRP